MIRHCCSWSTRTAAFFVITASLLIPAVLTAQISNNIVPIDSIVALVDEDVILRSELDLAVAGIVDRVRASGESMPQIQRAMQTGIRVSDADIDQALVTLAQQNDMTLQQLRQVIEGDGESFAEFRQNIGEEMMTERLRQRIVNGMEPITDTEIDIMLTSQDLSGGEYNISHIMAGLQEGPTPQQVRASQEKADEIYERLVNGLDFASAAISYSDGSEALEGGLVGWRDLNSVPAFFADAVRELQPGEFTQPIRSPAGYHILKVNDYREQRQVVIKEYHEPGGRHGVVPSRGIW